MDYFIETVAESKNLKGLLLYHKLGSGKTATSLMIANKLIEDGVIDNVYIMSPGSLRNGWVQEYVELCGFNINRLQAKYSFITYNYNVGERIKEMTFDHRSLVIIDEVHNIINGFKNELRIGLYYRL